MILDKNIRYTSQRVAILEFLEGNYTHPTAEQVYDAVKKKLPRISMATVYQNLRFLSEKGLLEEVNIKGVARFEPNLSPHHHIICRECGAIIDFESKELTDYAMELAKGIKGVTVDSANTNFYGVCKRCKEKKWKRKR